MSPIVETFAARDFDLAASLDSGQAFRWERRGDAWEGVLGGRWVQLRQQGQRLFAATCSDPGDWTWLRDYLRLDENLAAVLAQFPDDPPLRTAVATCRGLRLLRQEPWECLASFLLSSSKQIVQIRQIVALLCRRFGHEVKTPPGHAPAYSFPPAQVLSEGNEGDLRACKMGFRASFLRDTSRAIAGGHLDLSLLKTLPIKEARERLMTLPGVGRKIADCVLLFACGFSTAFPVDVWVMKALRESYFATGSTRPRDLIEFSERYFGSEAGYAQQYLFHYMRLRAGKVSKIQPERASALFYHED